MADPLESLRLPPSPVDPDPAFTARLRARITRALALPEGVTVSNLTLDVEPEPDVAAPPAVVVVDETIEVLEVRYDSSAN